MLYLNFFLNKMKTKIIGLTGGIGSGKTTIATMFEKHGFPVYIADNQAKNIMAQHETITKLVSAFGTTIIVDQQINKKKLAEIVFNDQEQLEKLNAIIHPLVQDDFTKWLLTKRDVPFVIKESAILFESGSDHDCFKTIAVSAPAETRIARVMKRDMVSREDVVLRMDKQLTDQQRESKANFTINNIKLENIESEVIAVISAIKNSALPI